MTCEGDNVGDPLGLREEVVGGAHGESNHRGQVGQAEQRHTAHVGPHLLCRQPASYWTRCYYSFCGFRCM